MTVIVFTPGPDGHNVRFAYDPTIVATIKQTVPSYARSWNPDIRIWLIDPFWAPMLADTLRGYGHIVTGLRSPPRYVHTNDDSDWARLLFKRVGRSRSDQIYRALSRCLHPDVGGDTALQRELNAAHAELSTHERRESA